MKIAPCLPSLLPLKTLNGSRLLRAVGESREALARFDEALCRAKIPAKLFDRLVGIDLPDLGNLPVAKTGYRFAFDWVKKKKRFNASFFTTLHGIVKHSDHPSELGKFRTLQNWIGPQGRSIEEAYFLPPPPSKVPTLMHNLSSYLARKTEEPLVQLAIAFAQLLIIHPFLDGNGRVGRVLIPAFLWKNQLLSQPYFFMGRYFRENRLAYFQKLYDISADKVWEDWILFFLKGIQEEAKKQETLITIKR